MPGLEGAFVYGSIARGDERSDSDVDVLLVGGIRDRVEVARRTMEAGALLVRGAEGPGRALIPFSAATAGLAGRPFTSGPPAPAHRRSPQSSGFATRKAPKHAGFGIP
ncbi:MAG: nucleotidyltransferase domain-containing protein [Gemmatimonadetes bacterium]|nr:nucleotidyltransferase domain-containing protein [Gemmatimonadota bacterium]